MRKLEILRDMYPPGTRISMIKMPDPPETLPIPPGTIGTVKYADDAGQLHIKWENGRSLAVIPGVDEFLVVFRPKQRHK